jgi:hypothetical protein
MTINLRDITILKKIVKYCDDIDKANAIFGNSQQQGH